MQGTAASTNWRRHATLLAVLALSLRILIPSGWMPATDRLALTPCFGTAAAAVSSATMSSTRTMAHHTTSHREGHEKSDAGDKPCAFTGFACALAQPDVSASAAVRAISQSVPAIVAAPATVGAGLAAPPPPPTGPPAIA
jgi:hypothetical protein